MASTINSTDTGSGGLITTGDSSDELQLQTAEVARVTLTNTAVVVNESGADVDFRVESDTVDHALFVEGSSGNVGIGTSTITSLGANVRSVNLNATTGSGFVLKTNDSDAAYLYQTSSGLRVQTAIASPILFLTDNAERGRFDSDGLKFNGDTAAANALDDYEQGTWTPVPTFTGTNTPTYGSSGNYTKIGNRVFFSGAITSWNKNGSTGDVTFTGLPFTSANVNHGAMAVLSNGFGSGVTISLMATVAGNSTFIVPYVNSNNYTQLSATNVDNDQDIQFSGYYIVA